MVDVRIIKKHSHHYPKPARNFNPKKIGVAHKMTGLKELRKQARECETLKDALELELSYDNSKGTPTEIQDFFRELKYKFVMPGLKETLLDHACIKFYNYSMQGYLQLMFDPDYTKRVEKNMARLSEIYNVPVKLLTRQGETVLNVGCESL